MKTLHHSVEIELALRPPQGNPITLQITEVAADLLDGTTSIARCFLTFTVDPDTYRRIDDEALFHLDPDVRGPLFGGQFAPDADIEIEAKLAPEFLYEVSTKTKTVEALAEHLRNLSHNEPGHLLLSTDSWFALYVKQAVTLPPELGEGALKVGYRTVWADSH